MILLSNYLGKKTFFHISTMIAISTNNTSKIKKNNNQEEKMMMEREQKMNVIKLSNQFCYQNAIALH